MKNLLLSISVIFVFTACTVNKQPEPITENNDVVVQEATYVEPVYIDEKKVVKKKKVKKTKKVKGTHYRMLTKSIEVFTYRGSLRYINTIDDKKLKNPFYIKGNLVRIEKIYSSKIGDRYGKIAGKNLLVSMDDLTKR